MRRKTFARWLVTAWTTIFVLGCRTSSGRLHYPEDPLLSWRSPVAGKTDSAPPVLMARAEPAMPGLPAEVLAAQTPPARTLPAEPSPSVPARLTHRALA